MVLWCPPASRVDCHFIVLTQSSGILRLQMEVCWRWRYRNRTLARCSQVLTRRTELSVSWERRRHQVDPNHQQDHWDHRDQQVTLNSTWQGLSIQHCTVSSSLTLYWAPHCIITCLCLTSVLTLCYELWREWEVPFNKIESFLLASLACSYRLHISS